MPELPEVEIHARGLDQILIQKPVIQRFEFNRADLRDPIPKAKLRQLVGHAFKRVYRRGKYLIFESDIGFMISHLGMTGSWRVSSIEDQRPHDHVHIFFEGGLQLTFRDPRRFGILDWATDLAKSKRLNKLGLEPLQDPFDGTVLKTLAGKRQSPIKSVIMDAGLVVGVGNIYASESLFRAGIRPTRKPARMKQQEWDLLASQIKEVLAEAIAAGGSSISDYVSASGGEGDFQNRFQVYDREGALCLRCSTPIRKIVIAGRSSFYCPACQK